jgi:hypothetical protein
MRLAQRQAEDFATLAAEYDTLARTAQEERWEALLERSGLDSVQLKHVRQSEARGPLLAALRDAEARGLDVEGVLPKLVASRSLDEAADPASVMHGRVDRWAQAPTSRRRAEPNLIAGLVPRALGVTDPDMEKALYERDVAMERRARELAAQALERGQPWVRRLGAPPADRAGREQWLEAISTVAAYRDRLNIGNDHRPLGSDSFGATTGDLRKHAAVAVERALRLSNQDPMSSRAPLAVESRELEHRVPAGIEM